MFPPRCGACDQALAFRPRFGLCPACFEVLEPNTGPRCERCDHPIREGQPGCDCHRGPAELTAIRAPWIYGGGLRTLVSAAKFHQREDLATALGWLLADDRLVGELARGADGWVPVPLSRGRRRERGFNQSAIIARCLARTWGGRVRHLLTRTRETRPQSDLALAARRANVAGAFCCRARVQGRLVLVDDVMTSGETLREAARALKSQGASEVLAVAVARAVVD